MIDRKGISKIVASLLLVSVVIILAPLVSSIVTRYSGAEPVIYTITPIEIVPVETGTPKTFTVCGRAITANYIFKVKFSLTNYSNRPLEFSVEEIKDEYGETVSCPPGPTSSRYVCDPTYCDPKNADNLRVVPPRESESLTLCIFSTTGHGSFDIKFRVRSLGRTIGWEIVEVHV